MEKQALMCLRTVSKFWYCWMGVENKEGEGSIKNCNAVGGLEVNLFERYIRMYKGLKS